jgi:radical SAM protein with 4Fe4S-binding SPASM domain
LLAANLAEATGEPVPLAIGRVEPAGTKSRDLNAEEQAEGRYEIFCQKPWTDLHNFTVDGRLDVCCIATGSSQEQYKLGNLTSDSFQDIWNGPAAKQFRRTVNSKNPLPPCARCPLGYAYQGMWFDPIYTREQVSARTADAVRKVTRSSRFGQYVGARIGRLVERSIFPGFKLDNRWRP